MGEMRGRPLAWVCILVTGWVGGRAWIADTAVPGQMIPSGGTTALHAPKVPRLPTKAVLDWRTPKSPRHTRHPLIFTHSVTPAARPWAAGGQPSGFPTPLRVAAEESPMNKRGTTPLTLVSETKAGTFFRASKKQTDGAAPNRMTLYAFSFWRAGGGNGAAGFAPAAQYGGSQTGMIATWDILGKAGRGPALLARVATTPDGRDREGALGVRWQPDHRWPVSLSIERRFRDGQKDAFAAYVAGGFSEQIFRERIKIDAFGQAGLLHRDAPGIRPTIAFYDTQIRATHPAFNVLKTPVAIGVGGWAGGQTGASRLDLGPTVSIPIDAGPALLQLQLDWRFRLAGNARPRDGPALTVSTGF